MPALDDQPLLLHALNRPVESSGAHLKLAVCSRGDILNDRVTVPIAISHGYQDVKRRRRKRQQVVDIGFRICHDMTIAILDILSMAIDGQFARGFQFRIGVMA